MRSYWFEVGISMYTGIPYIKYYISTYVYGNIRYPFSHTYEQEYYIIDIQSYRHAKKS